MDTVSDNCAIQKYERLLYKIAVCFGFSDGESVDLVQQVGSDTNAHPDMKNHFGLRIGLSKIMFHKCIFKISSELFTRDTGAKKPHGVLGYSGTKNPSEPGYPDMPLSVWAVYLLDHTLGFNEVEIAEIMNITLIKVKDRLNKAMTVLNKR